MMNRRFIIYICVLLLPLALSSCKGGEPEKASTVVRMAVPASPKSAAKAPAAAKAKKATAPVKAPVAAKAKKASAPAKAPAAAKKKKEIFAGIERDPFMPWAPKVKKGPERIKGPLECCELTSFKILAVITGISDSRILVMARDGKRYVVKKGDLIGTREGRVVSIEDKGMVVEEEIRNDEGQVEAKNRMELNLPSEEAGTKKTQIK